MAKRIEGLPVVPPVYHVAPVARRGAPAQHDAVPETALADELKTLLPAALVSVSAAMGALPFGGTASLAAALGSRAAEPIATALVSRFRDRLGQVAWPAWLQLRITSDEPPPIVTMTEFSNRRNHYVDQALKGRATLLSKHGTVVAAIVPLEPGGYERTVYTAGASALDVEDAEALAELEQTLVSESRVDSEPDTTYDA